MPSVFIRDLIKVYRTLKSEVIALRGLDMTVADGTQRGRAAAHRLGDSLGERPAADPRR